MIRVNFEPDKLTGPLRSEWEEWLEDAEAATKKVIDAWEEWRRQGSPGKFTYTLDQKVWARLKEWLLTNVFHGKCAYCESRDVRSPYHAEHFRPKGRVTAKVKSKFSVVKTQDEEGQEIEHPGYFWLAYNWANLVPSCNDCNTARGKRDQFPVKKACVAVKLVSQDEEGTLRRPHIKSSVRSGVYYLQPEDLDVLEEPLLLHPYFDDPDEHLIFGEFGMVAPREDETGKISEKGEQSIAVYDLAAERLRIARQEAQEAAFKDYNDELKRGRAISKADRIRAAKAAIRDYLEGTRPYSAAVLAYLRIWYPDHDI
jgi:hypothetical protein